MQWPHGPTRVPCKSAAMLCYTRTLVRHGRRNGGRTSRRWANGYPHMGSSQSGLGALTMLRKISAYVR